MTYVKFNQADIAAQRRKDRNSAIMWACALIVTTGVFTYVVLSSL